jgi:hypothetical protein
MRSQRGRQQHRDHRKKDPAVRLHS